MRQESEPLTIQDIDIALQNAHSLRVTHFVDEKNNLDARVEPGSPEEKQLVITDSRQLQMLARHLRTHTRYAPLKAEDVLPHELYIEVRLQQTDELDSPLEFRAGRFRKSSKGNIIDTYSFVVDPQKIEEQNQELIRQPDKLVDKPLRLKVPPRITPTTIFETLNKATQGNATYWLYGIEKKGAEKVELQIDSLSDLAAIINFVMHNKIFAPLAETPPYRTPCHERLYLHTTIEPSTDYLTMQFRKAMLTQGKIGLVIIDGTEKTPEQITQRNTEITKNPKTALFNHPLYLSCPDT